MVIKCDNWDIYDLQCGSCWNIGMVGYVLDKMCFAIATFVVYGSDCLVMGQ